MAFKQIRPRSANKIPELSRYTVMISRGLGKIRSFSFSPRSLVWVSVILALYGVVSSGAIVLYLKHLDNETIQSDRVNQLAAESEATRRALYQARQRLQLLEDTISGLRDGGDVLRPNASPPAQEKPVAQKKGMPDPARGISAESPLVIERLTTKRKGERLTVAFRLTRTAPDGNQLRGHLFIIAANTASDPMRFWIYPRSDIKDGIPADYTRGQTFTVRNYRIIQKRLDIDPPTEPVTLLRILAYNRSGTLILEKSFVIEAVLEQAH